MIDLAIVGGGVNGLAIAREAASRGLGVVLLERSDIAGGASGASSHLIHGGLKYLEHLEFSLVWSSIREQRRLLDNAPHLTSRYPMLIPFYRGGRRPRTLVRAGMVVHDLMALDPRHRSHGKSRDQVVQMVPALATEGLVGGAVFSDAQVVWPERLCVELMLDAELMGARIMTHTKVTGFVQEDRRVVGVRYVDQETGTERTLTARLTINATGPWIDQVLTGIEAPRLSGGTKGSHLVLAPFPGAPGVGTFFESRSDGRPVFLLPWNGLTLLGSTDLTFTGDLDDVRIDQEEVSYLLAEANRTFPSAGLTPANVLYAYSGIRPLPYHDGVTDNAKTSRDHHFFDHAPTHPGLVTVIGGKLTTHRQLGEEAVTLALRELGLPSRPSPTRQRPLPGADLAAAEVPDWAAVSRRLVDGAGLPAELASSVVSVYGVRAHRLVDYLSRSPAADLSDTADRVFAAELALALDEERASTLADALLRRMPHRLSPTQVQHQVDLGLRLMTSIVGWDPARAEQERAEFAAEVARARHSLREDELASTDGPSEREET